MRAQLQQSLGVAYDIQRELGGGGMSRVFVAGESRLGRTVVIKVLAPELAASISSDRFEREIRILASLQQANIVPLLAAGRTDGLPYYTMPLVDGRSLRDRLTREGPLPISDAVSVLRDVARALAYAHERGVVHRDIKPANVLLSGGAAVVSDFGIAKALSAARTDASQPTLTLTGMSIGTPAYMSPEQASGDPNTDHRTDIYAFGCLAYEVVTGAPPFQGQAAHQIVAAHFQEIPRPASERRPEVPPALDALIARCLEKSPDRRPQSAAGVLDALDAVGSTQATFAMPPARLRWRTIVAPALAAAVVAIGGAYLVHRVRAGKAGADAQPVLLAVLPFRNVGVDTTLEYRADGISDELLTAMGKVRGVRVTGRTEAERYKGKIGLDRKTVERDLGARLLVTGTVRESGGRLVVSAQLNDSTVPSEIWSDTFERDSKSLGSVTDDIARVITDTLRARFGSRIGARSREPTAGTSNPEALDLFLLGQELVKHRGSGITQGVAKFESAIALDSSFARAWAALAKSLEYYPYFVGTPFAEVRDRVRAAARRALALDSTLADAHIALAATFVEDDQWSTAVGEFRRAIALEPDNADAHFTFARFLMCRGETDSALAELRVASRLEGLSSVVSIWMAFGLYLNGQADSALIESAQAVQLDSTLMPTTSLGSIINLGTGHPDVARRLTRVEMPLTVMTDALLIDELLGDTATVRRRLQAMTASKPRPWFTDAAMASVMLARHDTAGAITALERSAAASGGNWTLYLPITLPVYDSIRRNQRFIALERAAGLDERVIAAPRGGRK
ncbi:MAG: protein kinase domain-containing protein [Gemmatimonadaceae bacterium]